MRWIKTHKRIALLFPVLLWFLYILTNISDFRAVDHLAKKVVWTETVQNSKEYTECIGTFQAEQYRIHSFEVRFEQKIKPDRIQLVLSDERGKIKTSVDYIPHEMVKKHIIEHETYINKNKNYTVTVKVYTDKGVVPVFGRVQYNAFLKLEYMAAVCLSLLTVAVLLWSLLSKSARRGAKARLSPITMMCIILQSIIAFWAIENIFRNDIIDNIPIKLMLINWGCCLSVYIIMLFLINSARWTVLICNTFFVVWGLANQYVYMFKGQALMPVDLKSIRTAANVATEYDYTLTPEMRLTLSVMILCSVAWICCSDRKIITEKSLIKRVVIRIPALIFSIALGMLLFVSEFIPGLGMRLDMWNSRSSFHQNGTVLAFCGYWHLMQVEKPVEYSAEAVSENAESVERKSVVSSEVKPNIVVIMNEAFVDLSYYGTFETNIPYMQNYNDISENAIKGHALVNIIGGGTANSEYEYLTGHSLAFMSSSIPYAQHIQENHYSMASNLSAQGYDTIAIHPLHGVNWRRNTVYPYLGFDEFIAFEDMDQEQAEYVRQFISDSYTYELIMDILKQDSDNSDFIFDVTVQNHSGYVYEKEDFQEEVCVTGFDSSEVNQYLTLIKISDEALGKLVKQLEVFEEPTILVFFGDHYPRLPEDFMTWINPENADPSLETLQKKYSVPFFIWANYDIEEETDVMTSLNFLGARTLETASVELSEYDKYRLEIAEDIPALNTMGYIDEQGMCHKILEDDKKYQKLQQYWLFVYNEVFDVKNRVDHFFGIENKESK